MKLYLTAAGVYAGTQQEAKRDGKGWKLEEVPVSKYELIDYLNKLKHGNYDKGYIEATVSTLEHAEPEPEQDEAAFVKEYNTKRGVHGSEPTPSFTTNQIVSHILDRAATNQIEDIFAALGQRFSMLLKGQTPMKVVD